MVSTFLTFCFISQEPLSKSALYHAFNVCEVSMHPLYTSLTEVTTMLYTGKQFMMAQLCKKRMSYCTFPTVALLQFFRYHTPYKEVYLNGLCCSYITGMNLKFNVFVT